MVFAAPLSHGLPRFKPSLNVSKDNWRNKKKEKNGKEKNIVNDQFAFPVSGNDDRIVIYDNFDQRDDANRLLHGTMETAWSTIIRIQIIDLIRDRYENEICQW